MPIEETVPKPLPSKSRMVLLTSITNLSLTVGVPAPPVCSSKKLRIISAGAPSCALNPSNNNAFAVILSSKPRIERLNSLKAQVISILIVEVSTKSNSYTPSIQSCWFGEPSWALFHWSHVPPLTVQTAIPAALAKGIKTGSKKTASNRVDRLVRMGNNHRW